MLSKCLQERVAPGERGEREEGGREGGKEREKKGGGKETFPGSVVLLSELAAQHPRSGPTLSAPMAALGKGRERERKRGERKGKKEGKKEKTQLKTHKIFPGAAPPDPPGGGGVTPPHPPSGPKGQGGFRQNPYFWRKIIIPII